MMIIRSEFKPVWWLANRHLQTIWASYCRRPITLPLRRERLELPDGDFIDLDWCEKNNEGPIVLFLHGLGGHIDSAYAKGLLLSFQRAGWRSVFKHFRGCSGEPNRLPRSYHSGETEDIGFVVETLKAREPGTPLAVVGISLGGNVVLKWLAEKDHDNPIVAAVAVSVPFDLEMAANYINTGVSRLYQWWLLWHLKVSVHEKFKNYSVPPIDLERLKCVKNFWEFDELVTAPLHGFKDAKHYYSHASSRQYLKDITKPTLILQSVDDPFMPPSVIPEKNELSNHITLELTDRGGHVGFIESNFLGSPAYWLEKRIPEYLSTYL